MYASKLADKIRACTRCRLRRNICCSGPVPWSGPAKSPVVVVGEAPGETEDKEGRAFCGRSGKLLDEVLFEVGMPREHIAVMNTVCCRPPYNRDPIPDEIEACDPWFQEQLTLLNPLIVVPVGKFATEKMLGTISTMTEVRGKKHSVRGRWVIPTWHPAYILRMRGKRPEFEEDFLYVAGCIFLYSQPELSHLVGASREQVLKVVKPRRSALKKHLPKILTRGIDK